MSESKKIVGEDMNPSTETTGKHVLSRDQRLVILMHMLSSWFAVSGFIFACRLFDINRYHIPTFALTMFFIMGFFFMGFLNWMNMVLTSVVSAFALSLMTPILAIVHLFLHRTFDFEHIMNIFSFIMIPVAMFAFASSIIRQSWTSFLQEVRDNPEDRFIFKCVIGHASAIVIGILLSFSFFIA